MLHPWTHEHKKKKKFSPLLLTQSKLTPPFFAKKIFRLVAQDFIFRIVNSFKFRKCLRKIFITFPLFRQLNIWDHNLPKHWFCLMSMSKSDEQIQAQIRWNSSDEKQILTQSRTCIQTEITKIAMKVNSLKSYVCWPS